MNDIFVNTVKLEDSNKPKRIKHKRRKTVHVDSEKSSSDEVSSNSSDDGIDKINFKKNKKMHQESELQETNKNSLPNTETRRE